MHRLIAAAAVIVLSLLTAFPVPRQAVASDDMKIDEPIRDNVELDHNVNYIYVKAVGRAGNIDKDDLGSQDSGGGATLGSVIVEPGADVGDITLIFDSDNNTLVSN